MGVPTNPRELPGRGDLLRRAPGKVHKPKVGGAWGMGILCFCCLGVCKVGVFASRKLPITVPCQVLLEWEEPVTSHSIGNYCSELCWGR